MQIETHLFYVHDAHVGYFQQNLRQLLVNIFDDGSIASNQFLLNSQQKFSQRRYLNHEAYMYNSLSTANAKLIAMKKCACLKVVVQFMQSMCIQKTIQYQVHVRYIAQKFPGQECILSKLDIYTILYFKKHLTFELCVHLKKQNVLINYRIWGWQ